MRFDQALYPTIIVALVALNRSPIDNGISQSIRQTRGAAHEMHLRVSMTTVEFRQNPSDSILEGANVLQDPVSSVP